MCIFWWWERAHADTGENMLTPHRNVLPKPSIEPRTLLMLHEWTLIWTQDLLAVRRESIDTLMQPQSLCVLGPVLCVKQFNSSINVSAPFVTDILQVLCQTCGELPGSVFYHWVSLSLPQWPVLGGSGTNWALGLEPGRRGPIWMLCFKVATNNTTLMLNSWSKMLLLSSSAQPVVAESRQLISEFWFISPHSNGQLPALRGFDVTIATLINLFTDEISWKTYPHLLLNMFKWIQTACSILATDLQLYFWFMQQGVVWRNALGKVSQT